MSRHVDVQNSSYITFVTLDYQAEHLESAVHLFAIKNSDFEIGFNV